MPLSLEDSLEDILNKALSGQGQAASEVLQRAELSGLSWNEVLRQRHTPHLHSLARVLGLHPQALVDAAASSWSPAPVSVPGLEVFTTPFGDMLVNSFAVWDEVSREGFFFDTGAEPDKMVAWARQKGITIRYLLLTHTHPDHAVDVALTAQALHARAVVHELEPLPGAESLQAGAEFIAGSLRAVARHTWGHSRGGTTFVISGLSRPVAIVGDAVFAGSIGGAKISYSDALRTAREEILSLPDDTVLAPGHGPLTTVAEEKIHNPFLAS